MNSWWRIWRCSEASLRTLYLLLLGQVVSLVLAISSFTSSLYSRSWFLDIGISSWALLMFKGIIWFFGAALCVAGLGLVLLSDAGISGGGGSRPLLGDTLVIAGTLCIAMSNVGEMKDRVELMSMLGLFGLLVSVCGISIVDLKRLESVEWSAEIILAFASFALSNFMFYTLFPFLLKVDWLYYLDFAVVAIGIIIYSNCEKDPIPLQSPEEGNLRADAKGLMERVRNMPYLVDEDQSNQKLMVEIYMREIRHW